MHTKKYLLFPLTKVALLVAAIFVTSPVSAATFAVNTFADGADNVCDLSSCTLREAIYAANNNGEDDTIILDTGTYQLTIPNAVTYVDEDLNATGDLDVNESGHTLTIQGNGFAETSIDANGTVTADRAFDLVTHTTIDGVTIENGAVTGIAGSGSVHGGGVNAGGANQTYQFSNCRITHNFVTLDSATAESASGGGIFLVEIQIR